MEDTAPGVQSIATQFAILACQENGLTNLSHHCKSRRAGMAREAYYRRMAQRYRELAAGSPDLEMAECWRAAADECDKLAEATNASPPESHRTSMQRQPMRRQAMQQQPQKKLDDET